MFAGSCSFTSDLILVSYSQEFCKKQGRYESHNNHLMIQITGSNSVVSDFCAVYALRYEGYEGYEGYIS